MPPLRPARPTAFVACIVLSLASLSWADHPEGGATPAPDVADASGEGREAIGRFKVAPGLKVGLFAAEPLLANPVAFCVDGKNRFYVAETFRHSHGVTDTRGHMTWLDDDLASRSVADRLAMYRKHLGEEEFARFGVAEDRVRLVEDRDGDGEADHATVFADGFRDPAAGIGAGVLAWRGDVYYTCIPDLWRLRDGDGDGKADVRRPLHSGYGVHVGFLGHDLHGLRFGPDGRLYFSVGDRGTNVKTADRSVFLPDTGAVFRCEPDGSGLEVFASGLRNPQELAFDEFGNLFTVDNNSDSGDRARLVHLVEGGDSGWRIGYQFIESPNSRGPWNAEKLWHPSPANTAAYLLPPLANISDGPSGLTYDPGVTLLPERYRRHFFLADFRGSANSGVRSFALEPRGASFELADQGQFLWGLEATDVEFGNDGGLYVSDWVEGWNITGKGRIYRVADPDRAVDSRIREVRDLLATGLSGRPAEELSPLLGHPDARIRQEAQFALVDLGAPGEAELRKALVGSDRMARIHALWGLGQLARTTRDAGKVSPAFPLLGDPDAEIRAQAAKVLGDARASRAREGLEGLLGDESPRVRFFAAMGLGKIGDPRSFGPLVRMIRAGGEVDPYLRHAAVMGLVGLHPAPSFEEAANDLSADVRMAVLLTWRRARSPEVARFLDDSDPALVLEAARAIYDVPIDEAMPRLASRKVEAGQSPALLRRILAANFRLGETSHAAALAALASRADVPESIRVESLSALGDWAKPSGRDRVVGVWRPLPERSVEAAAEAAGPVLTALLGDGPEAIRRAGAHAAGRLKLSGLAPILKSLASQASATTQTRIEALEALTELDKPSALEAVRSALGDENARLRAVALRNLAALDPDAAVPAFGEVLSKGSVAEKQAAFAGLGGIESEEADRLLAHWMDELIAGRVADEVRLDLLEAASGRKSTELRAALDRYSAAKSKDDPLADYREALSGGDAGRGRRIFREKADAQCLRCHKFRGEGGEVGPELAGIGERRDREYLLESIVNPNKQIAEGFESLVVATSDGQVVSGILKQEDDSQVKLMTPEGKLVAIPKGDIEGRKRGSSAMPEDVLKTLSKREIRDLVEFLARSKSSR